MATRASRTVAAAPEVPEPELEQEETAEAPDESDFSITYALPYPACLTCAERFEYTHEHFRAVYARLLKQWIAKHPDAPVTDFEVLKISDLAWSLLGYERLCCRTFLTAEPVGLRASAVVSATFAERQAVLDRQRANDEVPEPAT